MSSKQKQVSKQQQPQKNKKKKQKPWRAEHEERHPRLTSSLCMHGHMFMHNPYVKSNNRKEREKGETLYKAGGNINYSSHYESLYRGTSKKKITKN